MCAYVNTASKVTFSVKQHFDITASTLQFLYAKHNTYRCFLSLHGDSELINTNACTRLHNADVGNGFFRWKVSRPHSNMLINQSCSIKKVNTKHSGMILDCATAIKIICRLRWDLHLDAVAYWKEALVCGLKALLWEFTDSPLSGLIRLTTVTCVAQFERFTRYKTKQLPFSM